MYKSYYLFQASELTRKDNTIRVSLLDDEEKKKEQEKNAEPQTSTHEQDSMQNPKQDQDEEEQNEQAALKKIKTRYLPVEQIEELYVMTSVRLNSALLNFLGKSGIPVHFFDYYEHYTGSFMPKEQLLAGRVAVEQVMSYSDYERRMKIAKSFLSGGVFNMRRNLLYYKRKGADFNNREEEILSLSEKLQTTETIQELMGIEGNIRQHYYACFSEILKSADWLGRKKHPATDPVNALISFANGLLYAKIVGQIYHTQLLPTISFLHEPGERRFSLALDISEVFKPILVDRLVFRMFNRGELSQKDFEQIDEAWFLKDRGKKIFLKSWEELLATTIQHKALKKKVSYGRLIRLEMYKLLKDILQIEEYKPFKMWW